MTSRTMRAGACAIATLLAGAAGGCQRSAETPGNPVAEAMRAELGPSIGRTAGEGRRVFLAACATCHGDEGRGDGQNASRLAPRPPDLQTSLRALSAADVRRIVEHGSAAVGRSPLCPPHARDLGPEAIDAVLGYMQLMAKDVGPGASPD